MKNYIFNLIHLPRLFVIFSIKYIYQKRFIKNTLSVDIAKSNKTNDSSLDDQDFKKITDYYGYAVSVMFGETYCILRGKKMSLRERSSLTNLAGLTGLFDDFFDKKEMTESYIKNLLENPYNNRGKNSNEQLCNAFYLKALENSADIDLLKSYALKVTDAQILSKKQLNQNIDQEEIKAITYLKGGNSVLFYRCALNEEMSDQEKQLLYKLGAIWQLENDMLDIYKDGKDGIKTLATTENKMNNLRKTYTSLMEELVDLVYLTKYSDANKKMFLRIVALFVSIGFVCLDMLEKNEKLTNNSFVLAEYERKQLICDMEKPANIMQSIHYYAKCRI